MLVQCSKQIYRSALEKHFARLSTEELIMRFNTKEKQKVIEKYLSTAEYPASRESPSKFPAYHTIYYLYNNVEYNFPHTLDNIIILPTWLQPAHPRFSSTILHELIHIYFRYHDSQALKDFCRKKNIHLMRRPQFPGEITNPDTYYYTCWVHEQRMYFCTLMHIGRGYEKQYWCTETGLWLGTRNVNFGYRLCTPDEIRMYDDALPFHQNEHPEEMIAEYISS